MITNVNKSMTSDNMMIGGQEGGFELPYPMKHILEVEEWVCLFKPEPLYGMVEHAVNDNYHSVKEGEEYACESCGNVRECGFDYDPYFTESEYRRVLSSSRACSLDCAISHVFRAKSAPSVGEFKSKYESYKSLGRVDGNQNSR